jgi:sterol desaturase/sphingolipid hydroxylase (fatty acid hydroxylase superfamily)
MLNRGDAASAWNEPTIRLAVFLGVLAAMAVWEVFSPRRARPLGRMKRWPGNVGIAVLDGFVGRLVAPAGAVGFAWLAETRHWGLLQQVAMPAWLEATAAFIALDLGIYSQHRLFHAVPWLWRFHRMHHSDVDLDVTSGARFHPVEILLSLGIKFGIIVALGAPPSAVFVFEIVLNATSMFNHSNVRIPACAERLLRWLVVTPDMHRVHHSVVRRETDSNFGFNLPWWDRLLGTYRPEPEAGQQGMTIGLEEFRDPRELRIDRLLSQPFRDDAPKASPK